MPNKFINVQASPFHHLLMIPLRQISTKFGEKFLIVTKNIHFYSSYQSE